MSAICRPRHRAVSVHRGRIAIDLEGDRVADLGALIFARGRVIQIHGHGREVAGRLAGVTHGDGSTLHSIDIIRVDHRTDWHCCSGHGAGSD